MVQPKEVPLSNRQSEIENSWILFKNNYDQFRTGAMGQHNGKAECLNELGANESTRLQAGAAGG